MSNIRPSISLATASYYEQLAADLWYSTFVETWERYRDDPPPGIDEFDGENMMYPADEQAALWASEWEPEIIYAEPNADQQRWD